MYLTSKVDGGKRLSLDGCRNDNLLFIVLPFERMDQVFGGLAERSKAAVLKTVVVRATWGSNP